MKEIITDIAFIVFAAIFISRIVWEVVPDCFKKYWNYIRMVKKDRRKGRKRKYVFSFKN